MLAQERLVRKPAGLVRIVLKRAYADGTVTVESRPLSRSPAFGQIRHQRALMKRRG